MSAAHRYGVCACGATKRKDADRCRACYTASRHVSPVSLDRDLESRKAKRSDETVTKRYREALARIEELEAQLTASARFSTTTGTLRIAPKKSSRTSEATAVMVASDWHAEERVGPEVGDLNRHDLTIAERRAQQFFANGLRLVSIVGRDVDITTVVVALLGDFISNAIHDELVELNQLTPIEALSTVQGWLISGFEFALAQSRYAFVVPCHSGNHARTTDTTRFGTEHGHSLEHLMYRHLAAYFRHEPRLQFMIPEGMHSYVQVYDQTIRFQHGHAIKYGGGVGGIYIPVNKAIAQWNKAKRADLDVFGHFHQLRDGGNFVCNGSQIGYNSYALSIKADYESPRQAFFLLDKKRGKTFTAPILYDV